MKPRKPTLERIPSLTAGDLMTRTVFTLRPDHGVREAAALLLENNVHGAPVVDDAGKVLGVFSVTDVTRYERERDTSLPNESDYQRMTDDGRQKGVTWSKGWHLEAPEGTAVREVMSPFVISVYEDASITDVVSILLRNQIQRLIVVREPGPSLVGVVSGTDVLAAVYAALCPESARSVASKQ